MSQLPKKGYKTSTWMLFIMWETPSLPNRPSLALVCHERGWKDYQLHSPLGDFLQKWHIVAELKFSVMLSQRLVVVCGVCIYPFIFPVTLPDRWEVCDIHQEDSSLSPCSYMRFSVFIQGRQFQAFSWESSFIVTFFPELLWSLQSVCLSSSSGFGRLERTGHSRTQAIY